MNEEYLTTNQTSDRTKFAPQTIYNNVHKGIWKLGEHYLKPSSRKLLFKWSAIQAWLEGSCGEKPCGEEQTIEANGPRDEGPCGREQILRVSADDGVRGRNAKKVSVKPKSSINI